MPRVLARGRISTAMFFKAAPTGRRSHCRGDQVQRRPVIAAGEVGCVPIYDFWAFARLPLNQFVFLFPLRCPVPFVRCRIPAMSFCYFPVSRSLTKNSALAAPESTAC